MSEQAERERTADEQRQDGEGVPVFDPSETPEDFGGTPKGEIPGEQAGDPTPRGDLQGRRRQ